MKHLAGMQFQIAEDTPQGLDHPDDIEALGLWAMMGEGVPVIETNRGDLVELQSANRDCYIEFATVHEYLYILARDTSPGIDKWRFTKKP